jgi:hypothetical protein
MPAKRRAAAAAHARLERYREAPQRWIGKLGGDRAA